MKRAVWWALLAMGTIQLAHPAMAAERKPEHGLNSAEKKLEHGLNPANDQLLKRSPQEQEAMLAKVVGHWCIGTQAFLMGVTTKEPGKGFAYWSLRCADGSTWAVQLDPHAAVTAIDCGVFKDSAIGKECFKKF
jgi:hypothetical protein